MNTSIKVKYKMWKQSLYKWDSWIQNRHRREKQCDSWSQFIIEDCVGTSAVFNSGGMFFQDFMPDITVIEFNHCPINVDGMLYLQDCNNFDNQFDNLIMINPISLKYNYSVMDFLINPGISRAGFKPNILNWLKKSGKIYLSWSDWHMYYDRLKFTVHDMVADQIKELQKNGIRCEYSEISNVNSDVENGNIKLVLSVKNMYNSTIK
jgi:hypothetical protein